MQASSEEPVPQANESIGSLDSEDETAEIKLLSQDLSYHQEQYFKSQDKFKQV